MLHTIEITNAERFERVLSGLQRRASRIGLPPIKAEQVGERYEKRYVGENGFMEPVYEVIHWLVYEVESADLVLEGDWRLIAVFDLREGLVQAVPGEEVGPEWWEMTNRCDYCGLDRDRSEVFLVANSAGEYKVVGRTCLGDFLGISPAEALKKADWFKALSSELGEPTGERVAAGYDLVGFLTLAVQSVRSQGWVSKAVASTSNRVATANEAWFVMTCRPNQLPRGYEKPTTADREQAERVAEYMRTLDAGNDYERNLRQIGENGYVTHRSAGFAASGVVAYSKHLEQRAATAQRKHLGAVGEKLNVTATLVRSPSFEGAYGVRFFHKFQDSEGNVVLWKTSTELEPGMVYELSAKVKEHGSYGGTPETEITRAKYQRV